MMSDRIVFEKNGKTITLAEHSGFCYGVKTRASKNSEDGGGIRRDRTQSLYLRSDYTQ